MITIIFLTFLARLIPDIAAWKVDCNGFPDGTFLPHPTDCSKYFECDHNIAWPFQCANETWFDTTINSCNWPDQVECNITTPTTNFPTTTTQMGSSSTVTTSIFPNTNTTTISPTTTVSVAPTTTKAVTTAETTTTTSRTTTTTTTATTTTRTSSTTITTSATAITTDRYV